MHYRTGKQSFYIGTHILTMPNSWGLLCLENSWRLTWAVPIANRMSRLVAGGFKGPHSTKLLYFWSIMLIAGKDAKKTTRFNIPKTTYNSNETPRIQFQKCSQKKTLEAWTPHQNPKNLQPKSSANLLDEFQLITVALAIAIDAVQ